MKRKNLPKLNYYNEFIKNATIALEISEILKSFIANFDNQNAKEIEEEVHKFENDADQNLHELLNFLNKDFLPPIDREDIILLANKIDDVIDGIDETVINIRIFNITTLRSDINDFVNLINKFCIMQKEMLEFLRTSKKFEEINKLVIKINNLEDEGDRLYEHSIRTLFKEENPIDMIKWEKIYTSFECCFDFFENVANTVGEIVMKNS